MIINRFFFYLKFSPYPSTTFENFSVAIRLFILSDHYKFFAEMHKERKQLRDSIVSEQKIHLHSKLI